MRSFLLCLLVLTVAAADPASDAAELDVLIDAQLAAAKQQPNPPADPATLVRRTWIDLGGRLPTVAESRETADLPRRLVGSPAWEHATFTWLADILRVQSRLQDRTPGAMWIAWLDASVIANRPWDVMARDMVTATGPAFAADGGATGFALRDAGMPLDHAALMAQTFLGTRIGCAQCHDHPYDRWTRLEFIQFASFSADAKADQNGPKVDGLKQRLADAPPDLRNMTRAIASIVGARIQPARKDWLEIPKDWQYEDHKPGERVTAAALFAPASPAAAGDPRLRLAAWMTSPDNPRFALAIGNRAWKRMFGLGLIEPVDDLRGEPGEALPALEARLAKLVVDAKFDLQRIHLTLALTRHYARASWSGELPEHGGVAPGRPSARIPATVWWDSLVAMTTDQPDARVPLDISTLTNLRDQTARKGADGIIAAAQRLQALRKGGTKAGKEDPEMAVVAQMLRPSRPKAGKDALLRASQLPQPTPPGHPLRVLGQSDRELIDNASVQPATTQALLMMNGVVDGEVLSARSRLMHDLNALTDGDARIAHLWQAVLVRAPTAAELAPARRELQRGREGLADLAWTLLNSSEFRTIR